MQVLDLFSGIGGFALGLESVGMTTVAFCEQDGYARRVLKKHWPTTWIYEDVRTLTAKRLKADGIGRIDIIAGGFPCQDISCAGKGAGIEGARSGLWSEYARLIREVRPRWVLAENVPALRSRGADRVLGDLEGLGYSCWPLVVGALHAGAPHRRQRVWLVVHDDKLRRDAGRSGQPLQGPGIPGPASVANAEGQRMPDGTQCTGRTVTDISGQDAPDSIGCRCPADRVQRRQSEGVRSAGRPADRRPGRPQSRLGRGPDGLPAGLDGSLNPWHAGWEDGIPRVADGIPARTDRLRCLGNSVVPQCVAMIGRAILEAEASLATV